MRTRVSIIATVGPACADEATLRAMAEGGMDAARFNFSWKGSTDFKRDLGAVRAAAAASRRKLLLIGDLPGPRVQEGRGHTYDAAAAFSLTERDEEFARFCIDEGFTHIALSFVGSGDDMRRSRERIERLGGGTLKLIAKIERKSAVLDIDRILKAADAVMVARGDLGREIPLPTLPFVQRDIIRRAGAAGKPSIVATQMLESMVREPEPTRAEVTDISQAILEGADAVMLSEETAVGARPVEAVRAMESIALEAERHLAPETTRREL